MAFDDTKINKLCTSGKLEIFYNADTGVPAGIHDEKVFLIYFAQTNQYKWDDPKFAEDAKRQHRFAEMVLLAIQEAVLQI